MEKLRGMIIVRRMNKIALVVIVCVAIILLALSGSSQLSGRQSKLPWYEVEDWEVDVCSKFGGRSESENSETFQFAPSYGDMTITLQARRTKSRNETLYEVSYFIESYSATTDYKILLKNQKTNAEKEISRGNLGPASGATDYWTQSLKEEYTIAIVEYYKGRIIVPIVEVR